MMRILAFCFASLLVVLAAYVAVVHIREISVCIVCGGLIGLAVSTMRSLWEND